MTIVWPEHVNYGVIQAAQGEQSEELRVLLLHLMAEIIAHAGKVTTLHRTLLRLCYRCILIHMQHKLFQGHITQLQH